VVIIDCDPLTVPLYLPACAGAGPFEATLTRCGADTLTLVATLDVPTQQLAISGIPADAKRGVWTLNVKTSCGCFNATVFLDLCRAPGFVPTHTPTPGVGTEVQVCCDPEGLLGHVIVGALAPYAAEYQLGVDGETVTSATLDVTGTTLTVVFSVLPTGPVRLHNSYGDLLSTQPAATTTVVFEFEEALPCDTYALSVEPLA
jgi:hypothetical protein